MFDSTTRLPDVQALADSRSIAIDSVGIKGIKFPHQRANPRRAQPADRGGIQHVRGTFAGG